MLEKIRIRLAGVETGLPYLAILGLLSGLLAGLVIVAFRMVVETTQSAFLVGGPEDYESLSWQMAFLLPTLGGLVIGLLFEALKKERRHVGVAHVIERLTYYQGNLPMPNAVHQFVGAALSIISGHSVGREGPAVHLGAAAASQLGRRLALPNNSVRTLVGCGVAAAIAASFNTPLSGVVFAMEVVLLEYTIVGFIPVILAAVAATTLTRLVYGEAPAFIVPPLDLASVAELPWVIVLGFMIGILAMTFVRLLTHSTVRTAHWPFWIRTTLAGLITGLVAMLVPQIMGIGYDTVNGALLGEFAPVLLLSIAAGKLLATALGIGLGLPGGLIGPTLVIGAAFGGAFGVVGEAWFPGATAEAGFYALLGMGAMMGAVLQAPLAALVAMLELTSNPHVILPGMLAVVIAALTARQLFGTGSVFLHLMRARGLDYRHRPVAQALRRVGVASVMDRDFVTAQRKATREALEKLLARKPRWVVVEEDGERTLLRAADLVRHLHECEEQTVDLDEIPGERLNIAPIHVRATLQEAYESLARFNVEALYVERTRIGAKPAVYGILTHEDIESYRTGL